MHFQFLHLKKIQQIICLWVACLTLAQATIREEAVEDIMERVLDNPNNDRVLNSVLGRLERNRQGLLERLKSRFGENADCDESEGLPEYTESVENPRERGLRHLEEQLKHDRMCRANRTIHRLNTLEYEYRPAYYEEVRCDYTPEDEVGHKEQICSLFGLSCVQSNKTIHLTRRRYTSDCWETKTIVIPAGCECMWPVHKLGAISSYV